MQECVAWVHGCGDVTTLLIKEMGGNSRQHRRNRGVQECVEWVAWCGDVTTLLIKEMGGIVDNILEIVVQCARQSSKIIIQ